MVFLWGSNNVNAQKLDLGFSAGMNVSSHLKKFIFTDNNVTLRLTPEITAGYQSGFLVRKDLSPALRVQTEPTLILLGAKYSESFTLRGTEFKTESKSRLYYLQLPLLLQLSTNPPNKNVFGREFRTTNFHLTGGVFGGYLLDGRFKGTNTGAPIGIPFEGKFQNDITSQYNNFDGGVILGIGVEHGRYTKLGFETRALFSVFDTGNMPSNFEPQNMALTFAAYYIF